MNASVSLPTHRLTYRGTNGNLNSVIVPTASATMSTSTIDFPTSVPSGYARQAQLEATAVNGFKAFRNGLAR